MTNLSETRIINVFCPHRCNEDFENLPLNKLIRFSTITREDFLYLINEEYNVLDEYNPFEIKFCNNDLSIDDFQCIKCFKITIMGQHYDMELALDTCLRCDEIADDFRLFCGRCAQIFILEFFRVVVGNKNKPKESDLYYNVRPMCKEKLIKKFYYKHLERKHYIISITDLLLRDVDAFFQPIREDEDPLPDDDFLNRTGDDLFDDQDSDSDASIN